MENPPFELPELKCQNCGWPLIKNGELKCSRSGHTVLATLGQKDVFCPHCRKPRVLLSDKHQRAVCPQCKTRTLITKEVAQMTTTTAEPEAQDAVQEQKHSKTQELRDWLDAQIGRSERAKAVLEYALHCKEITDPNEWDAEIACMHKTSENRYGGLTPDETDVKMAEDRKTLEQTNKNLELLKSARELDIDIDALEDAGFVVKIRKNANSYRWSDGTQFIDILFVQAELRHNKIPFVSLDIFLSSKKLISKIGGSKVCGRINSSQTIQGIEKISVYGYKSEIRNSHTIEFWYGRHGDESKSCFKVWKLLEHTPEADEIHIETNLTAI